MMKKLYSLIILTNNYYGSEYQIPFYLYFEILIFLKTTILLIIYDDIRVFTFFGGFSITNLRISNFPLFL